MGYFSIAKQSISAKRKARLGLNSSNHMQFFFDVCKEVVLCRLIFSLVLAPVFAFSVLDPYVTLGNPTWTNNQLSFTLIGESDVSYFIESSPDLQNWVRIFTNSEFGSTRLITIDSPGDHNFYRASRGPVPRFFSCLAAKELILNGNNLYVDAYDSADTIHFPGGLYRSANAFAGGDVAVQTGILGLGNVGIHGRILLGSSATFSLGSNGFVGDMPSNWPAQSGVQSADWIVNDFNKEYPDVVVPFTSGLDPAVTGNSTNQYDLTAGNWYVNGDLQIANNKTLYVRSGDVNLYITGNLDGKPSSTLKIAPGASLKLYVGSSTGSPVSATLGQVENIGNVFNFQFYGLKTLTSYTLSANGSYVGTVYAPECTFSVSAGGNNNSDFQGAFTVNSVSANGSLSFHFDVFLNRVCFSNNYFCR